MRISTLNLVQTFITKINVPIYTLDLSPNKQQGYTIVYSSSSNKDIIVSFEYDEEEEYEDVSLNVYDTEKKLMTLCKDYEEDELDVLITDFNDLTKK